MIFFKPVVTFKMQALHECALGIFSRYIISKNVFEIEQIKEYIGGDTITVESIEERIRNDYYEYTKDIDNYMNKIRTFWELNKDYILDEISSALHISGEGEVCALCEFCVMPLAKVDYYNRTICLPIQNSAEENIRHAISYLVKCYTLFRIWDSEQALVDLSYKKHSRYWILADLVADAICYNTGLKKYNVKPAYKYYYNLQIEGESVIDKFRRDYVNLPLYDFIKIGLRYVKKNIDTFKTLKNRY